VRIVARSAATTWRSARSSAGSARSAYLSPSRVSRRRRLPVPASTSSATTLSLVRPYASEREPQALLPIMPPIVQRAWVDGSGPKRRP
jgi:hypothetical protein